MSDPNTYKGKFIADFRRDACQATAANMLDNGFLGTFDEAFEHAHTTELLQAQTLVPDPEPIPKPEDIDPNMPAAARVGLGLMAMTPAVLDTNGTPLDKFWDTAVSLDSVLSFGNDVDRAGRGFSAARIMRGLIEGAGTDAHRTIMQSVLGIDLANDPAAQLQAKYRVDDKAVRPLTIPDFL